MTKRIASCLAAFLLILTPFAGGLAQGGATVQEAVSAFLAGEMAAKALEATDAWQKYVYGQGVTEVQMNLEKFDVDGNKPLAVTFLLCSGAPDWKEIGRYGGDPEAFLAAVAKSAAQADTQVKLSLKLSFANGAYSADYAKGGRSALEKAVKKAAAKGKKAMASKAMLSAAVDYLTPAPVAVGKKAPDSLQEHQPAFSRYLLRNPGIAGAGLAAASFYTMKGQKLDVSGGPGAIRLQFTMADMAELSNDAYLKLYQDYCYDEKAKQYTDDELGVHLERAMEQRAADYRHSRQAGIQCSVGMDLFDLPRDMEYSDYLPRIQALAMPLLKQTKVGLLKIFIEALPDYPALEFPENGVVEGSNRGTKVIVRNKHAEAALSLTFIKENGGDVAAVVFVRPSGKVTFRIPKGYYRLETQVGFAWYGAEHRFGEFTATDVEKGMRILGTDYYHTLTYGGK